MANRKPDMGAISLAALVVIGILAILAEVFHG